ncbi:xylulose kinase [Trichuris trichiura]|uniref:Xylulose kinase n=1 Tax=Trichuris trichiura TaxID=36087 RepID=A0A077ZAD1_TRITR|nr:xylulose kinase [Trichuris trichiura]
MEQSDCYYLGFDLGTQQLKCVLTDNSLAVRHVVAINYDVALPMFRTSGGVRINGAEITAPVLMWIKALELALDDLKNSNFDLSKVLALSGAAQQHGSVYWKSGAEQALANLNSNFSLAEQLKDCFATSDSPVWMDHSTQEECKELEAAVGGALSLAKLTGSAAHLRFTGPQLLKKCRKETAIYNETEASNPLFAQWPIEYERASIKQEECFAERVNRVHLIRAYAIISLKYLTDQCNLVYKEIRNNFVLMISHVMSFQRISLVSSFLCTLFLGRYAPIDFSDGSGMNLLNLKTHMWAPECLKVVCLKKQVRKCMKWIADISCRLKQKAWSMRSFYPLLGDTAFSSLLLQPFFALQDCISPYFVKRYGFSSKCRVVVFTGDNPCGYLNIMVAKFRFIQGWASLAGLNQRPSDLSISLGTSDTVFVWMSNPIPISNGHIFCNPIDPSVYMGFRNGDCTRKEARRRLCGRNATWSQFEDLVESSPPGNCGCMGTSSTGVFYEYEEIGSKVLPQYVLVNADGCRVPFFEKQIEARAVIEHQCLAKRLSSYKTGMRSKMERILVTGGASNSGIILQTLSDVFDLPVYKKDVAHSAALGGAVRAKHALIMLESDSFLPLEFELSPGKLVAEPRQSAVEVIPHGVIMLHA